MKIRLNYKPISSALLCLGLLCVGSNASAQIKASNDELPRIPDLVEIDIFGGVSVFGQVNYGLNTKLINGGDLGVRVGVNVTNHVALEFSYSYMVNNVRLVTPIAPGFPSYNFSNRIFYPAGNLVYHFTRTGSFLRPFVTVGVGPGMYNPTDTAKNYARNPIVNSEFGSASLGDNLQVVLNYGGGVKLHLSRHIGLRFEVDGWTSRNPTFGLPNFPTGGIYIPNNKTINGMQATVGASFYFGPTYVPPPQVPCPAGYTGTFQPNCVKNLEPLNAGAITGYEGLLCQAKAITLHSTASDPAGHTLGYAWKLNGATVGTNSADYTFTPNNAGDDSVEVVVTDTTDPKRTVTANAGFSVKEYLQPQITALTSSAPALSCPSDANGTHTANLSASGTGSGCGGNLTYVWKVSEGSISGSGTSATFDTSSLTFDTNSGANQTKTVTATVTVTDDTGHSASKTLDIPVSCPPNMIRQSDIVFPKDNARVNNCGKDILKTVASAMASSDYDVVLIGHIDGDEKPELPATGRGKNKVPGEKLDEARALNSAAVLSGGGGTCASIDVSRIKVAYVGTAQGAEPNGVCGTSAHPDKERRKSVVNESDKNRRVEVYLVPKGATKVGTVDVIPAPDSVVKALGCPK
jgi:outer membrane protein OmpA-like peptidoglycan-associated protein